MRSGRANEVSVLKDAGVNDGRGRMCCGLSDDFAAAAIERKQTNKKKHLVSRPTKTEERSPLETDQEFQLTENIPVDGLLENGGLRSGTGRPIISLIRCVFLTCFRKTRPWD